MPPPPGLTLILEFRLDRVKEVLRDHHEKLYKMVYSDRICCGKSDWYSTFHPIERPEFVVDSVTTNSVHAKANGRGSWVVKVLHR